MEITEEAVATKAEDAAQIVKKYMLWSAGAGAVPFAIVDIAAVTGVQLKMLADMSALYEVDFSEQRAKSIISALVGGLSSRWLAFGTIGSMLKVVPVVGYAFGLAGMPLFAAATTYAVGRVFIQHFETGGTLLNFDAKKMKEHFAKEFEKGREEAGKMKK